MHQGFSEYNKCTLLELLYHVNDKYAKMDNHIVEAIMETFDKAPDMDRPIDEYFAKQEECQRIASNTDYPIDDARMVLVLTKHMGMTGILTRPTTKFKRRLKENKTWIKGK